MDFTIDGVEITEGMRVWNYDLRVSVVGKPDPCYGEGWFDMRSPEGGRMSAMNGERMWFYHPRTGQPA